MHTMTCQCPGCRGGNAFEAFEFGFEAEGEGEGESSFGLRDSERESESPFSEAEETELALELLSVSSEEELDQFLGKLFKGIKKVGSAIGKVARPLGGVLKGLAKTALPFVGGALGSFIPIPGVGTAIGSALGSAVSSALEAEFSGLEAEEQEFEMARRFVRIAGTAAQQAAQAAHSADPQVAVRSAVLGAAKRHLPRLREGGMVAPQGRAAQRGRWVRRGNRIVVVGL